MTRFLFFLAEKFKFLYTKIAKFIQTVFFPRWKHFLCGFELFSLCARTTTIAATSSGRTDAGCPKRPTFLAVVRTMLIWMLFYCYDDIIIVIIIVFYCLTLFCCRLWFSGRNNCQCKLWLIFLHKIAGFILFAYFFLFLLVVLCLGVRECACVYVSHRRQKSSKT